MRVNAEISQLTSSETYMNVMHEKDLGYGGVGVWICGNTRIWSERSGAANRSRSCSGR